MLTAARRAATPVRSSRSPLPAPRTGSVRAPAAAAMSATAQPVLAAGSLEPPAGADRLHPTFITTWSCPYAQRSWIALNAKGLEFTPVFVDLQSKPEWFMRHNPYGRVPTLVWQEPDGKTTSLYESLVVNEYLADLPGPELLPTDAAARAHARLLIDQFGAKVGGSFGKVMFAGDASSGALAEELTSALTWLDGELSKAGEGPLALGKDLSLVDAAIAPFLLRLPLLEALSGYKLPTGLDRLSAYIAALAAHPAVKATQQPPGASGSYEEQLVENYRGYVAARRAAAAAT